LPPIEKLPWERSDAENKAISDQQVQEHFAPKPPPPPKEKIHEKIVETFLKQFEPPPEKTGLSDYERSICKSFQKGSSSSSGGKKCGKTVPQLGEQRVQSIAPLKVSTEQQEMIPTDQQREAARTAGISVEQYIAIQAGDAALPTEPDIEARIYAKGEPLVNEEEEKLLQTQMRNLHQWYKREIMPFDLHGIMFLVKQEYFHHGIEMWIANEELFQLFHQKALDKSLVSCYCL